MNRSLAIRTRKFVTIRAIAIGWALLLAFNSIPLGTWLWNVSVAWELDAVRVWWFGGRSWPGLGMWVQPLLFGVATGYLVARFHQDRSMAMVSALISTVALASVLPYVMWAQRTLSTSSRSETLLAFMLYVQAWAFLSGPIGMFGGGLLGAGVDRQHDDTHQRPSSPLEPASKPLGEI